ncbi:hypothetical protein ACFL5M_04265 [Candidatus Neomarinimicrobiota bacterium]
MRKILWLILFGVVFTGNTINGQSLVLRKNYFNEFVTFYVSSVDVSSGATDVRLFEYELAVSPSTAYPVQVDIEFEMLINSLPLGLTYSQPFLDVKATIDSLWGPVRIANTELSMGVDHLTYSGGPRAGEDVNFTVSDVETIFDNPEYNLDNLQSSVMQTGRLPDGTYRFVLRVMPTAIPGYNQGPWSGDELDETIVSAHPISMELISPGGPLEDTTNTAIMTTYPFFQWQSDPCAICSYQIRVAEYIPGEHSSMEDAIEDQTVLPLEQALGWHEVGSQTSLQYPQTGAIDLEAGHTYVWQVQKLIPTTEGDEAVNSFIWAFLIIDPTQAQPAAAGEGGVVVQGPILQFLQAAMGADVFDQAFSGGGDLEGFQPSQVVRLNGDPLDPSRLNDLNNALQQGTISIVNVEVQ